MPTKRLNRIMTDENGFPRGEVATVNGVARLPKEPANKRARKATVSRLNLFFRWLRQTSRLIMETVQKAGWEKVAKALILFSLTTLLLVGIWAGVVAIIRAVM